MAVRSKRLTGVVAVSNNATLLYTVPAGKTALVKTLSIVWASGTAGTLQIFLNGSGGLDQLWRRGFAGNEAQQLLTWWALHPGDELRAVGSINAPALVTIFGTELEGVAD